MKLKGKGVGKNIVEGEVIVSKKPLSFLGGVDPETGIIIDPDSDIKGESIEGKILVFPKGRGSTVGSYVIYALSRNGKAPKAIIVEEAEPIVTVGAIISGIPLIAGVDISKLRTGMKVRINPRTGEVEIIG
ncbi:DUF126 domain-containing protein [Pyrococcus abyssi]|uniref:Phosphomevalonate dehydratase small subunit n=1 Tax=Pyrococcus abyssi (strain GE5 / Orsay) TaxID=272844 RepID=PMDHS_PYRAB|nr:DUF126 domain-containing protein [Pyrococcus abyssi]Q9UY93.1 RecName: Full=UPF0107 protein PYRAB16150 [Pyrococcus abyssi GE5]CAB50519.1 Hypothetical protein PAB1062 [Pyrococcus abyssi GE5]CCE71076.1 TPA: hypothetical protein PAB1062 [Pyrococcus abyssi GE5]